MGRRKQCIKPMEMDMDNEFITGTTGVTDVAGMRTCYLCSQAISGEFEITGAGSSNDTGIDVFINTLSEVCGMPIESVLEAANEETTALNLNRIVFCNACQFNLHKFRDIKAQLRVLKLELSQVKGLITATFLSKSVRQDVTSKFNADCPTAPEVCSETVTGDLELGFNENVHDGYDEIVIEIHPNMSDAEDANSRDPDWDPLESYTPKLRDKYSPRQRTSPCNQISGGASRAQKARLRALLKRQKAKRTMKTAVQSSKLERKTRRIYGQGISTYTLKCPSCPRRIPTEEMLQYHVRKIHEEHPTPYYCKNCDQQFQRLGELRRHVRKTKACQLIDSSQPVGSNSDNDGKVTVKVKKVQDPNPTSADKVTCNDCGTAYKTQMTLDHHLKRQGGKCTGPPVPRPLPLNSRYDKTQKKIHRYICGECGKKYRSPHHLGIHIRAVHTDGFVFLCEYCCKPFNTRGGLTGHQRLMHLEEFLASQSEADAAGQLEKIRNLTCSFCQMRLSSFHSKRDHEAKHTNDFKYYCDVCGSGWTSLSQLKTHTRTHGEKKHKCAECGHTFDRAIKRDRHMRAKHGLGDKSKTYKCQFCDKCFWEITHLKRHTILLHPNPDKSEPPGYGCDLCSYACAIREYIIIHSRTKKHMQKVEALGLTDPKTGIRFPEMKGLARRNFRKPADADSEQSSNPTLEL